MRRLNTKLLISLIVGTLVLIVGVYFLHVFQVGRNASVLLTEAQDAQRQKNFKDAADRYRQYLNYNPEDREARIAYADLVADAAEAPDATPKEIVDAYGVLDATLRRHPELTDVRRRLVDIAVQLNRRPEAMRHIEKIQEDLVANRKKRDTALDVKHARSLMAGTQDAEAKTLLAKLLGFNDVNGRFDKSAAGAHEVEAYSLLADLMRRRFSKPQFADTLIEQMVAANPESHKAYLFRSQYRMRNGKVEEGQPDLERALKMAPDDVDVLLTAASYRMNTKDFEGAKPLLDRAQAKHPKNAVVYHAQFQMALAQQKPKEALPPLNEGIKNLPRNPHLLRDLAEVQLQMNDLAAVRKTAKKMRSLNLHTALVDLYEARALFIEEKWNESSRLLEKLRPQMQRFPSEAYQVDALLGFTYEKLGQPDRQRDAAERALKANPSSIELRMLYARAMERLKQGDKVKDLVDDTFKDLATADKDKQTPGVMNRLIQMKMAEQLAKPKDQRDFAEVDALADKLAKTFEPVNQLILHAQILMMKGEAAEARKLLTDAQKKYPKELNIYLALLMSIGGEPAESKEEIALRQQRIGKLIEIAEKNAGDHLILRVQKANWLIREGKQAAVQGLPGLEKNLEKFPAKQREAYLLELGTVYNRLGDYPNARRCWQLVATARPSDLPMHQAMFELALEHKDEAGIEEGLKNVQRIAGADSALAKYCQAARLAWLIRQGKRADTSLVDVRGLLREARQLRPTWAEPLRMMGDLDIYDGNHDSAIENYLAGLKLGPIGQKATERLIKLLYQAGRMEDIRKVGPQLGQSADESVQRIFNVVLFQSSPDQAIEAAREIAEQKPGSVESQLYYAHTLERANKRDDAEKVYRKVVQKFPRSGQAWMLLVNLLATSDRKDEVEGLIPQIEANVPEKEAPGIIAKSLDLIGQKEKAEKYYKTVLEKNPNDLAVLRDVAVFYRRAGNVDKSKQYVNALLKKGGKEAKDQQLMSWGRRARTELFALSGSYEELQNAIKGIEDSAPRGKMTDDDLTAIASVLGRRAEPESRAKAIEVLESLKRSRPLSFDEELLLAHLYERSGNWNVARQKMTVLASKAADNPRYLTLYANMLLKHGAPQDAAPYIEQLEKASPNADSTIELKARLLAKRDPQKAAQYLESLVPSRIAPNQMLRIVYIALWLEDIGQNEAAGRVLRKLRAQEPRATLMLASFLGRHGDVSEAFSLFEEARKTQPVREILPAALQTLRAQPKEADAKHYAQVERWIEVAGDEPNAEFSRIHLAELRDVQGKYSEAARMYREFLGTPNLTPQTKAMAQNNLAYLVASNPTPQSDLSESLRLVNDAMSVLGPSTDLLDTRAAVQLARGRASDAVTDLRVVVQDDPSASKYVHLARAERASGNREQAAEALKKAKKAKDFSILPEQDRKRYEALAKELGVK